MSAIGIVLKAVGSLLLVSGVFFLVSSEAKRKRHPGQEQLARYSAYVERMVRLCFLKVSTKAIVRGQMLGIALGIVLFAATGDPPCLFVSVAAIAVPPLYLVMERSKRIVAIDAQADGFILALANSLKAVPSCGAALQSVLPMLRDPIQQEIAIVLKEMRVGTSLEQALLNASGRVKSPALDSALSAVLVGRQVGGNLPKVLETTANTMREMNRLGGVVKSKTAEGRAQLWVLAVFPFGIAFAFSTVSPGYFAPLQASFLGNITSAVAIFFWMGALIVARKVLEVDL